MFNIICIAGIAATRANTTTVLQFVFRKSRSLNITKVRNCNHHIFVGIEIFRVEFLGCLNDVGFTFVTVFCLDFEHFVFYNLHLHIVICQHIFKVCNLTFKFLIFSMKLIHLQTCELTQTHFNYGICLFFVKFKTFHQIFAGFSHVFRCANDMNNFVDIIAGNDKTFQNMGTFLSLLQVELGTTDNHIVAVFREHGNHIL